MPRAKEFFGVSHVTSVQSPLWRQLFAEFLGVLFIVLIGCGSTISGWKEAKLGEPAETLPSVVRIALAFGLTVAAVVEVAGHVSGGHVNPAVTLGLLCVRRISLLPALLYIAAQMLGGIAGAAILYALTPEEIAMPLGANTINPKLTAAQGFGIEFLITALLLFTVFSVTDTGRILDGKGSASLAIGITVTVGHILAIKFTGCGMNPARVLGPAVITGIWDHHWAYLLGECGGAIAASLLYVLVFSAEAPLILKLCGGSRGSSSINHGTKVESIPVTAVNLERVDSR